jgi:hypothetical protein
MMGRSYTEPEVKAVPDTISIYYLSRTRDPDDEFATEQVMGKDWQFHDIHVSSPEYEDFEHNYLVMVIDSRYAAVMALQGWNAGRESVEVHYS